MDTVEPGVKYEDKWVERNLLYVAMSRPTHLFAFAMNSDFISEEQINTFKQKGWNIMYAEGEQAVLQNENGLEMVHI
ncbi:hypothetical protein ACL02P_05650 [Paenibacillus sp. MB22_1]|uniref:hypothetical protein n=1 Tax=unclassified Paenibacillus TaxID=185978 RepID=UPI0001AFD68F|nr:hypothetical protein [Paenibacillus sp. oral taxon 786]EES70958.1 hypothetical protein POTG_04417 [Paenibacillus sp. oral taxon 786 str. D14]